MVKSQRVYYLKTKIQKAKFRIRIKDRKISNKKLFKDKSNRRVLFNFENYSYISFFEHKNFKEEFYSYDKLISLNCLEKKLLKIQKPKLYIHKEYSNLFSSKKEFSKIEVSNEKIKNYIQNDIDLLITKWENFYMFLQFSTEQNMNKTKISKSIKLSKNKIYYFKKVMKIIHYNILVI